MGPAAPVAAAPPTIREAAPPPLTAMEGAAPKTIHRLTTSSSQQRVANIKGPHPIAASTSSHLISRARTVEAQPEEALTTAVHPLKFLSMSNTILNHHTRLTHVVVEVAEDAVVAITTIIAVPEVEDITTIVVAAITTPTINNNNTTMEEIEIMKVSSTQQSRNNNHHPTHPPGTGAPRTNMSSTVQCTRQSKRRSTPTMVKKSSSTIKHPNQHIIMAILKSPTRNAHRTTTSITREMQPLPLLQL